VPDSPQELEVSMFTIPQVNVIESDEGYSLEVLGRAGLRYREPPREMIIDSEVLMGTPPLVVYTVSIRRWNQPFAEEVIDEGKRRQIVDNIRRAFRFEGFEIAII
jgi:hypothetical protein